MTIDEYKMTIHVFGAVGSSQERASDVKCCAEQNLPVKSEFLNIKREILSAMSSVFDSLVIAASYVIRQNIIQELWRRHTE